MISVPPVLGPLRARMLRVLPATPYEYHRSESRRAVAGADGRFAITAVPRYVPTGAAPRSSASHV